MAPPGEDSWAPGQHLAQGFFADAGKTVLRPELHGEAAIKAAFQLRQAGVTLDQGRAFVAELEQAAAAPPATPQALQQAIEALAGRLLQPPFADRLCLYDFFSACAAHLRDGRDLKGLAEFTAFAVDRLAMVEALNLPARE